MPPYTLYTIPAELLAEILSNLDNNTLKQLRLAIPCPRILTATAQILFKTFTIRLASQPCSPKKLNQILHAEPPLSKPVEGGNCYIGIFGNIRRLVIDTRYGFVRDPDDRGIMTIRCDRVFLTEELPKLSASSAQRQTELLGVMVQLVEKIITTGSRLNEVSWLTSGSLNIKIHEALCSILCPAVTAGVLWHLDVKLLLNKVDKLKSYCPALSNIRRLVVKFINDSPLRLGIAPVRHLSHTILRSKDHLQHFTLDLGRFQTSPSAIQPLCSALEQATELRTLESYAITTGFSFDLDFTKLKKLDSLTSVQDGLWYPGKGDVQESDGIWRADDEKYSQKQLFQRIVNSGVRLRRICVMNYGHIIHDFLMQHETAITHLDLFGISPKNEELATLFWREVIPKYAGTLKQIGVRFQMDSGPWIWTDSPTNLAKLALARCQNLETVKICFIDDYGNYTLSMIESLTSTCPKLKAIYLDFCGEDTWFQGGETKWKLIPWESTNDVFRGRALTIAFEVWANPGSGAGSLPAPLVRKALRTIYSSDYLADRSGIPPLYDSHVLIWRLLQPFESQNGKYTFRAEEIYKWDDGSERVWGAYDQFIDYL